MEIEGFVFTIVYVGRIPATRRNSRLSHKQFASGLLASQKYSDLINWALVGSTAPGRYVPELSVSRRGERFIRIRCSPDSTDWIAAACLLRPWLQAFLAVFNERE